MKAVVSLEPSAPLLSSRFGCSRSVSEAGWPQVSLSRLALVPLDWFDLLAALLAYRTTLGIMPLPSYPRWAPQMLPLLPHR